MFSVKHNNILLLNLLVTSYHYIKQVNMQYAFISCMRSYNIYTYVKNL
jgi:hypothetical protein